MKVYSFRAVEPVPEATILTVGNFDGVHLGHQALIRRVVAEARAAGSASVVVTFDPHPQQVLKVHVVPLLTTLPLRLRLFEALGVDQACIIPFTPELAAKSAEAFLKEYLLDQFSVRRMVIGYDFAFGRNRAGTAEVLKELSARHGFALEIFPAVVLGEEIVSSTRIRAALAEADFAHAAELLGRPWSWLAPVERGQRLGRELGYPTLNQSAREPLPIPFGIYASRAIAGGRGYGGASSYGIRPTLGTREPVLETHLFDFEGDLYGSLVEVIPLRRLREERRFPSLDSLKAQIAEDCRQAREVLAES
jgi:riboflavin kinase/FMN adenylyltransferase